MHGNWYYVEMPWKVVIFHIQSAIKTTFLKGITWNLVGETGVNCNSGQK